MHVAWLELNKNKKINLGGKENKTLVLAACGSSLLIIALDTHQSRYIRLSLMTNRC